MKSYRIIYRVRGSVEVKAKDGEDAIEKLGAMKVKALLDKSSQERIDVEEV